jgi:hypothetical protein
LEVCSGDGAGFTEELVGYRGKGALHGLRVVLEASGRGTGPEGVELGDVEGEHVAFWGGGAFFGGGVGVGEDVKVAGGGGHVVVEVAEVGFVPHEGCHGFAAV